MTDYTYTINGTKIEVSSDDMDDICIDTKNNAKAVDFLKENIDGVYDKGNKTCFSPDNLREGMSDYMNQQFQKEMSKPVSKFLIIIFIYIVAMIIIGTLAYGYENSWKYLINSLILLGVAYLSAFKLTINHIFLPIGIVAFIVWSIFLSNFYTYLLSQLGLWDTLATLILYIAAYLYAIYMNIMSIPDYIQRFSSSVEYDV